MKNADTSIKIKRPFALTSGTGEMPAYFQSNHHGQIVVQKQTRSTVKFSIGDRHFTASSKQFHRCKGGAIIVQRWD